MPENHREQDAPQPNPLIIIQLLPSGGWQVFLQRCDVHDALRVLPNIISVLGEKHHQEHDERGDWEETHGKEAVHECL